MCLSLAHASLIPPSTEEAENHHEFKAILVWNETLPLKNKQEKKCFLIHREVPRQSIC